MRILHVLGKLDRGGVETWLVQALRHIDRQKYQMDFLVHTTEPGAYDEEVKAMGARIIPCLRPSNPALYAKNFFRILRKYGPYDVVHSHVHHFSGYVLMLAAMAGVKVRVAHSHSDTRQSEAKARIGRRTYRGAMRGLIRELGTAGLAVSTEAGNDLFPLGWRRSSRWRLHHLGIDLSRFMFDAKKDEVRRSLGIPTDALIVGHVGRFTEEKNHSFLIEIAREVISRQPRAFFLLVGDGPLRLTSEAKVDAYGLRDRFLFTGVRPDVPMLMKGAMDVFLFPSTREGLPITLLEAQAAGLKCIISDVISEEAIVIPNLVVRQSTATPKNKWAELVLEGLGGLTRVPTIAQAALDARSIVQSNQFLLSVYDNVPRP